MVPKWVALVNGHDNHSALTVTVTTGLPGASAQDMVRVPRPPAMAAGSHELSLSLGPSPEAQKTGSLKDNQLEVSRSATATLLKDRGQSCIKKEPLDPPSS